MSSFLSDPRERVRRQQKTLMTYVVAIQMVFTLQASAKANPLPSKMIIFHGNFLDISLNSRRPGGGLFTA